jgi:3-keto-5-aminohexanoate cleavage enzyme
MASRFILNFTPTGLIPTQPMTPHVPLHPGDIIREVLEMADLGVNMVHLHARDPETGEATHRKDIYAEIVRGIRKSNPTLVLGVSTSGRRCPGFEARSEVLDLTGDAKPDFASLTLSSLNFNKEASINAPDTIQRLASKMIATGIRPELEAFDLGMINYARYLIHKDLLRPPYYFNVILGNIACAQADLLSMGLMVRELPGESIWSAGGVGNAQLNVNTMSLLAGGGVRVGLEDNIWFDNERTRLATNRELVERVLLVAKTLGREPYTHAETRKLLGV